jgi:hypothetical protein
VQREALRAGAAGEAPAADGDRDPWIAGVRAYLPPTIEQ